MTTGISFVRAGDFLTYEDASLHMCEHERYRAAADPQGWHVMIVVLEGVLDLELGDTILPLRAAAHVFDSSQDHAFFNAGDVPVRFLRCTIW